MLTLDLGSNCQVGPSYRVSSGLNLEELALDSQIGVAPYIKKLFLNFLERQGSACWSWIGPTDRSGYGVYNPGKRVFGTVQAHWVHWTMIFGPIAEGLVLVHLCRVLNCVRLSHLELVTKGVKTMRGYGPTRRQRAQSGPQLRPSPR